jgi:hypothetical protein
MTGFWDIAQRSLKVDRRFGGLYCLCYQGGDRLVDVQRISETSSYF